MTQNYTQEQLNAMTPGQRRLAFLAMAEAEGEQGKTQAKEIKAKTSAHVETLNVERDAESGDVLLQLDIRVPKTAAYKPTTEGNRAYLMRDIAQKAVAFDFEGKSYVLITTGLFAVEPGKK